MQMFLRVLQRSQVALVPQLFLRLQGEGAEGSVEDDRESQQRQNSPNLIILLPYILKYSLIKEINLQNQCLIPGQ
jgi:hypothetical protein